MPYHVEPYMPPTFLYAQIRDEAGNKMPACVRIELCLGNECVAVFESLSFDAQLFWQYGKSGSPFWAFAGRLSFRIAGRFFNYTATSVFDNLDRFDIGMYDFLELMPFLYHDAPGWDCTSILTELADWLDRRTPLSPYTLSFLNQPAGDLRVYQSQNHD